MRNGDANSAVRILPADGSAPIDTGLSSEPPRQQRWFVPVLVVAGMLGVFVVATRPTSSDPGVPTTQPTPIAAIDADQIDLQTRPLSTTTSEWAIQELEQPGKINDVLRMGSSFMAVGDTPEGANVLQSSTGGNWRDLSRLDVPEDVKTSIDHAVNRDGGIVALGSVDDSIGLWTATHGSSWTYEGIIEAMGSHPIRGLATGPELLAISVGEGQVLAWASGDGRQWRELGQIPDLARVSVVNVAANDDWFFAFGATACDSDPCDGVIYRSANGTDWELVAGNLSTGGGAVTDMAMTPEGLLATGWVNGPRGVTTAVWRSNDGAAWTRIGVDASALQPGSIVVELLNARSGGNPVAEIKVGGASHDVTTGTEILTDIGVFTVTDISDSSVEVATGNERPIAIAGTSTIAAVASPSHIAAEGPRIIISGHLSAGGTPLPVVWVSPDNGATWSRQILPGSRGHVSHAGTAGRHIVAVGSDGDRQITWRATWDTEAAAAAGEVIVVGYLSALNNSDEEHLVGLLPKVDDGDVPPKFMVPSLGEAVQRWWDEDTGWLDTEQVAGTLGYLEETDTSIAVAECTSSATLGMVDRVNVRCDYTVDSSLLTLFGSEDGTGSINALVRNGILTTVTLDASASVNMWQILNSHRNGPEIRDISDPPSPAPEAIEFDRSTAAEHLELAETLLAGVLAPGTTTTVQTALGTMEWTWLTSSEFDPQHLRWIAWSELGFIATSYGDPFASSPSFSVWTSPDAMDWTEVEIPDEWDGLWDVQAFNDGVIGTVSYSATVALAYYDGETWTEIPLDRPPEVSYLDVARLAVSGDRAMAVTGWWQEDGLLLNEAIIIDTDLTTHVVELPARDSWSETVVQLAGSDAGFILGASSYFSQTPELSIWHTADGLRWTQLAETGTLGDARFVWNLQRHRSRYFVVGEGAELRCTSTAQGENCVSLIHLWSSPDGVAWDRVITELGEPVATYEIGSGPLGLVAFGQELADSTFPRSVYFSVDGETWATSGDLTLFNPGSTWWYIDTPAIGTDLVVAVGASYQESPDTQSEETFMLVGRLIDS